MTTTTSPLDAAREDLSRRRRLSDETGDGRYSLLDPLYDVADMVCRVGDHIDDTHYAADKAGDMVRAALLARKAAFERYHDAGCAVDEEAFADVTLMLVTLETQIEAWMWSAARHDRHYRSQAARLNQAVRAVTRWAASVDSDAAPDPVE